MKKLVFLIMFFLFFAGPTLFAGDKEQDFIVGKWVAQSYFASSHEIDYDYFWKQTFWFEFYSNGKGKYGIEPRDNTTIYDFVWTRLFAQEGEIAVYEVSVDKNLWTRMNNNYLHYDEGTTAFIFYLNQGEEINMQFYGLMRRIE